MHNAESEMDDLAALRAQCERLRAENAELRSQLGLAQAQVEPDELQPQPRSSEGPAQASRSAIDSSGLVSSDSPVAAKLALFRALFSGREEVFAVRWQSKTGRSGYAPACAHEWDRALCGKPARSPRRSAPPADL
jgi:hypothetical protein